MSLAHEVQSWILMELGQECRIERHSSGHNKLLVSNHVVICREFERSDLLDLAQNEVVLWKDHWVTRKDTIQGRLRSLLGESQRIHGRETQIVQLTQPVANAFIAQNHLLPPVKSRYKLGLTYQDKLMTVACFTKECPVDRDGKRFRSIEMTRFCHSNGSTVVGGLSKLIKHLKTLTSANDLMTQVDNSWFTEGSFEKVGFEIYSTNPPAKFWIHPSTCERLYTSQVLDPHSLQREGFCEFQTQGSTKMIMSI